MDMRRASLGAAVTSTRFYATVSFASSASSSSSGDFEATRFSMSADVFGNSSSFGGGLMADGVCIEGGSGDSVRSVCTGSGLSRISPAYSSGKLANDSFNF